MLLGERVRDCGALGKSEPDQDFSQRRAACLLLGECYLELYLGEDALVDQQLAKLKPSRFRRHALRVSVEMARNWSLERRP